MQLTSPTYLTLSGLLLAISSTVATPLNVFQTRNNPMTYVGCYSDSGTTGSGTDWTYQSTGWCQDHCVSDAAPVFALTGGDSCICADYLPDTSDKVDDSKCSSPCTGWPSDMCGGSNYYSIYKSGLDNSVSTKPEHTSSSSNSTTPSTTNGTSTAVSSGTHSGATQVVTSSSKAEAAAAAAEEEEKEKNAGAHDTASIAAGVVIGVVGIGALAGGAFFFFHHRKQKSPGFSRSQLPEMSDARYDGGYITNRRPSEDSIEYPDFSREVLQVTNPDRHY